MNFVEVVKALDEGKVFQRKDTRRSLEFSYLVKDEYGVLKMFGLGMLEEYHLSDEDVLTEDWVEVKKEAYQLLKIREEDGIQYFTYKEDHAYATEKEVTVFELKQILRYVEMIYADAFKEAVAKLKTPHLAPFDYDFRTCPLCENEIEFNNLNSGTCSNECVTYEVDPQAEDVLVSLFDSDSEEDAYFINLYEQAMGKNNRNKLVDLKKFQETVLYWRAHERYKDRLRVMKPMK